MASQKNPTSSVTAFFQDLDMHICVSSPLEKLLRLVSHLFVEPFVLFTVES